MIGDVPVIQGGAGALLAIVVWFILTGRLVPKSHVDDLRIDRDVRVAEAREERDEWKAAARTSAEQVDTLLPQLETMLALLRALQPKDSKEPEEPKDAKDQS